MAAKAGLAGLTRNAAHVHPFDRVRINGVDIGWTDTDGEDEIQRRFHLSERSGVVTGSVIDWDQNVPGAHD